MLFCFVEGDSARSVYRFRLGDDEPSSETDGLVALVCHGITNVKCLHRPPIVEMLPSIVSDLFKI